jgi:Uma2 family endonuclease
MTTLAPKRTRTLPVGKTRIRKGAVQFVRPKYDGLKMSLRDFCDWEREADGWKYEWNNGIIEINEVSMTIKEQYIVENIIFAFEQTSYRKNRDAILPEVDCWLTKDRMRRPDLAYFTAEQIRLGKLEAHPVPLFVIELISHYDRDRKLEEKLEEYFAAGVECVWYIRPDSRRVAVYTSLKDIRICSDEDVCSAAPALDFTMRANEIFA